MLLNCHSYYSFKYGTISPKELLEQAHAKGYDCLTITDINNTSACIDIVRMAPEFKIKPVVGIDFRNGIQQQYIGIAKNNDGFRELNEHLTKRLLFSENSSLSRGRGTESEALQGEALYGMETALLKSPHPAPLPRERESGDYLFNSESNRAPIFNNAFIIYPFGKIDYSALRENEFAGIKPSELKRLPFSDWRNKQDKLVLLQPVSFLTKRDFNAHRLLRAIDNNTLLSKLPVSEQASPDELLIPKDELCALYKEYPQIIRNTERLLSECSIDFEFGKNNNKRCFFNSPKEDLEKIRELCSEGLSYRYGTPANEVIARMEKELKVITDFGYCSYFLINWDLVRYAQRKGYYYVGRGSGANSMVAYLLRITDVDPIELDLYFERFINPSRKHPPDFDIDFSWTDREDITKYIFNKHGKEHTALLGAYNTFQYDSVLRELGKVFGLPADDIDKLQRAEHRKDIDHIGKLVLQYGKAIHGFPSHPSIHSSGILISEKPVSTYTATYLPPKNFPTTQFSMLEAEDIGLYKFDILSQRGLGKIKDSLELIEKNRAVKIDIHDVKKFKEDARVKELLKQGKAIGCFYIESPAMRMLLTKLKTETYIGLVAASSIIRPGVAKSGMMREYILRFRDLKRREEARKALPELYELLKETYGVMVYQEDVLKVAHLFAGLTLAEADILRRGMSWKFKERNEFSKVEGKFFDNCRRKGYDEKTIAEIWHQIESFANYAFAKGHSASYAVESFQALYLKAYFPMEYMVATINNGGGFYRPELYVHEARMHGAKIELPCINNSEAITSIREETIWLGFQHIQSIELNTISSILTERNISGVFKSFRDFMKRVSITLEQLRLLIRMGTFRFTGQDKKALLWDAHFLLGNTKRTHPKRELFDVGAKEFKLPPLYHHVHEDTFDEMELLGFPLCSPFLLLKEPPAVQLKSADLIHHIGKTVSIIGYLVHVKNTPTSKGEKMQFGVFLDLDGHWLDTVHFPPVAKYFPFRGPGCYLITGKVVEEFEFISIEVKEMQRLPYISMEPASPRLKPVGNRTGIQD